MTDPPPEHTWRREFMQSFQYNSSCPPRVSLLALHDPDPEPEEFDYSKSWRVPDDQTDLFQFRKKGYGKCRDTS